MDNLGGGGGLISGMCIENGAGNRYGVSSVQNRTGVF